MNLGVAMIAQFKPPAAEQRMRLSSIPWGAYVAFCDGLGDHYLRVTYDRGEMEIMSPSRKHEKGKKRLGQLVEALTQVLDIDIACGGSVTCRNEEMLRALEPDDCYWIAHEPQVRDCDELDLDIDPPPDLAMEIEISRSALDRMGIYAALKVPEIWRWDRETLHVQVLGARGTYRTVKRSKAFPFLPLKEFSAFLTRTGLSETKLLREFRVWVRDNREAWKI
jgi:Uma2 family endonuclease